MWVCASLQSCDGSEFTLQGPAGGDDITGLSPEPAHYQLLSELGESILYHTLLSQTILSAEETADSWTCFPSQILKFHLILIHCREGLQ